MTTTAELQIEPSMRGLSSSAVGRHNLRGGDNDAGQNAVPGQERELG